MPPSSYHFWRSFHFLSFLNICFIKFTRLNYSTINNCHYWGLTLFIHIQNTASPSISVWCLDFLSLCMSGADVQAVEPALLLYTKIHWLASPRCFGKWKLGKSPICSVFSFSLCNDLLWSRSHFLKHGLN